MQALDGFVTRSFSLHDKLAGVAPFSVGLRGLMASTYYDGKEPCDGNLSHLQLKLHCGCGVDDRPLVVPLGRIF